METNRLIYIRTDGNSKIASGHLARCFSIALACLHLGMEVCFLVSDEESENLLNALWDTSDFSVIRLKAASFDNLEPELPEVISLLGQSAGRSVIYFLDSYYVTEKYLSALKPLVKTAYLDDLQLFDYPVSLLINYDVISKTDMPIYRAAYQNAGQLLLGAAYAPLRTQFQDCRIPIRETVSNVLITTGAGDPHHFCLNLCRQLAAFSGHLDASNFAGMKFHIVIGKLNSDKEEIYQLTSQLPFFELHENVSSMASLMSCCDLAVSAAGTTLYELCALGIPSISFTMADNQLASARAFDTAGAVPCAGDIRTSSQKAFQKILKFISDNAQSTPDSYARRKAAHDIMNSLVDGHGALRIAQALKRLPD